MTITRYISGKRKFLGVPDDGWGMLTVGDLERMQGQDAQHMGILKIGGKVLAISGWTKMRRHQKVILLRVENYLQERTYAEKRKEQRKTLEWKEVRWDDEFTFGE